MFRNKDKCESKPENAIVTRENSGPTFKVSKPNNEVYKRTVFYSGAIEWNKLMLLIERLKISICLKEFKNLGFILLIQFKYL